MKIEGPKRTTSTSQTKKAKRAGKADDALATQFQRELEGATGGVPAEPVAPVAPVDALLALQEVGTSTDGRSKGLLLRGEQMIDRLRDIQLAMLEGRISKAKLLEIRAMVDEQRDLTEDAALLALLDDIELRTEVELAKLLR